MGWEMIDCPKMKRYAILNDIMLSFLGRSGTDDYLIGPQDGSTLEANEHTIWLVVNTMKHESITTANAIDLWLADKKIKEINE
jgi:hypothetical protein